MATKGISEGILTNWT